VLAAVSGGPDSTALLLLLARFSPVFGYRLEAAHFDHQIQPPAEREAESRTVRSLCSTLQLPVHEGTAPVAELARQNRRSLEEEARLQRYGFLAQTAALSGAGLVAVGHTMDDQAETILLHILRGSGLRGLAGMMADAAWPVGDGPRLIRPLLRLSRSDTQAYCRLRQLEPHIDSSNTSELYTRSRIRHELLPLLRSFNPRIVEALSRLGEAAACDSADALRRATARLDPPSEKNEILLSSLRREPPALRSEMLTEAYARQHGDRRGLTARHRAALQTLTDAPGEHAVDLPDGITAYTTAGRLRFRRRQRVAARSPAPCLPEIELRVPGTARFGDWELVAELTVPGVAHAPTSETLSIAVPEPPARIVIRSRRAGDRMRPAGLRGRKKLQDIFVDAHVPRSRRDQVPVVCVGDEIIWLVGLRRAEGLPLTSETERTVRLTARRLDDTEAAKYDTDNN